MTAARCWISSFPTVPEDDDPIFWARHLADSSNLRSLLSMRKSNNTTSLVLPRSTENAVAVKRKMRLHRGWSF